MADVLEKTKKAADTAIKWVAAEFYYTKTMKADLEDAKIHLENGRQDVRKAMQAMNYVGRAENRATRAESQLIEDIEALKKAVPIDKRVELDNVEKDIEIASRHLIKKVSRYEGHMRDELRLLGVQLKLLEDGKGSEALVRNIIGKIIDKIDDILKWLSTMQTNLRNAEAIEKDIESWAKG